MYKSKKPSEHKFNEKTTVVNFSIASTSETPKQRIFASSESGRGTPDNVHCYRVIV